MRLSEFCARKKRKFEFLTFQRFRRIFFDYLARAEAYGKDQNNGADGKKEKDRLPLRELFVLFYLLTAQIFAEFFPNFFPQNGFSHFGKSNAKIFRSVAESDIKMFYVDEINPEI